MIQPGTAQKTQVRRHVIEFALKKRHGRKIRLSNPQSLAMVREREASHAPAHRPQRRRGCSENLEVGRPRGRALKAAHEFAEVGRVDVDRQAQAQLWNRERPLLKLPTDRHPITPRIALVL